MVEIQSPAAEIRRGKKRKIDRRRRKKLQSKNIMAPLLHRAAIKKKERTNHSMEIYMVSLFHRATINKK